MIDPRACTVAIFPEVWANRLGVVIEVWHEGRFAGRSLTAQLLHSAGVEEKRIWEVAFDDCIRALEKEKEAPGYFAPPAWLIESPSREMPQYVNITFSTEPLLNSSLSYLDRAEAGLERNL